MEPREKAISIISRLLLLLDHTFALPLQIRLFAERCFEIAEPLPGGLEFAFKNVEIEINVEPGQRVSGSLANR